MYALLKRLAVVLLLLGSITSCISTAVSLKEGIKSFRQQDYRKAFIRLKPEAMKGQVDAQYAVGYMYYYGEGVVEDKEKAFYWIQKAAAGGQAEAIKALSLMRRV